MLQVLKVLILTCGVAVTIALILGKQIHIAAASGTATFALTAGLPTKIG